MMLQRRSSPLSLTFAGALCLLGASGCAYDCQNYENEDVSSSSCQVCIPAPDDCSGVVPTLGELEIHLSQPLPRRVQVHAGKHHETGAVVLAFTPTSRDTTLMLPFGHYSVTALYVTGNDSTLAVDGDNLEYVQLDTCDNTICYDSRIAEVNLALD
jgi:hypothetical protein